MMRFLAAVLSLVLAALTLSATAQVVLSFHSFDGSVLFGRYPHTFIVMEGTLDSTGLRVNENYGYTPVHPMALLSNRQVKGTIGIEPAKYVTSTNRHFSVPISDTQYRAIVAEMVRWRDDPGETYNLDRNNCVHFVARIASMAGLRVEVPQNLVRRPKAWLNLETRLNPQLGAREIR